MIFGFTGREPYVDSAGNAWLPATEWVVRTGHHTDPVAQTWWTTPAAEPISGTPDPELYRYGVHAPRFWVNVTVGPGSYGVRLKFAERRAPDDPKRLPMRVEINAQEVVASLDVSARAGGPHKALDLYFDNIRPRNGIIEIRLTATDPGEAVLQAIEVLPTGDVGPHAPGRDPAR